MSSSTDLTFALYHAIAYMTRSLIGRYSATTIDLLHFTLERNLAKQFESNWFPADPARGSGRRCLTLSPTGVPPRPIYYACKSARVNWEDWIACLGGVEMDLFIDPGCVSVRFGKAALGPVSKLYTVWSAEVEMKSAQASSNKKPQTIAQSIVDDDEDELFNMIADEIRAPTWMTPILNQFPTVPRPTVVIASPPKAAQADEPDSATSTSSSTHSRSSSRSSDSSSSGFSFSSVESADTVATSPASSICTQRSVVFRAAPTNASRTTAKSVLLPAAALIMQAPVSCDDEEEFDGNNAPSTPTGKTSRRDRARQAHVHIDATKTEVTPYDGGKTTVLTGGVMLGMKAGAAIPATPATPATPRFAATLQAASRKTIWRNPAATRAFSPRIRV
ncbi:hypothetical protein K439DRAFT_1643936 [Ramaria rubella]|nr:hypothetical protein K439DRAFT_1643936 [Ramaria rubella]